MRHLPLLPFRLVTGGILAGALLFKVLETRMIARSIAGGGNPDAAGYALLGLLLAVLSGATVLCVLLVWRIAHRPDARALALFLACVAYLSAVNGIAWTVRGLDSFAAKNALESTIPIACMGAVAALLRFSMLFPRPLLAEDLAQARVLPGTRIRLLRPSVAWVGALGVGALAQGGLVVQAALRGQPVASQGGSFTLAASLWAATALVGITLCVLSLWTGYRRADAEGRKRIFWVLEGLLVGAVIFMLASVVRAVEMWLGSRVLFQGWYSASIFVAMLAVLALLAFATFYHGALDPGLAIRRTAVFGLLAVVMVFAFAGVEQLVQQYLVRWLGLSDRLGGILTGGTVALTFEPMKRWIGSVVEELAARLGRSAPVPDETPRHVATAAEASGATLAG